MRILKRSLDADDIDHESSEEEDDTEQLAKELIRSLRSELFLRTNKRSNSYGSGILTNPKVAEFQLRNGMLLRSSKRGSGLFLRASKSAADQDKSAKAAGKNLFLRSF